MPVEYANLQKIARMKSRYPDLTVGFSTHESPDNTSFIGLAYAMGARMFEKHIGIATDTIKLNAYSATPEQVRSWLKAYKEARAACGSGGDVFCAQEIQDLRSLMRGTYFSRAIKKDNLIKRSDVFFAITRLFVVSHRLIVMAKPLAFAAASIEYAGNNGDERGLTAAGRPHHHHQFIGVDIDVHPAQSVYLCAAASIDLGYPFTLDCNGICCGHIIKIIYLWFIFASESGFKGDNCF